MIRSESFRLSKPIAFIGLTSFFTDLASECIYPLLPVFLTTVLGATPAFIGLVEGVAETTASLTKFLFGWISDKTKKRTPLVVGGYAIANLVRPLIGAATAPFHVLALRFVDRIGKGMRTAPRDAWLAALAPVQARGRVFGFHRAMDHAGAIMGPLVASAFLSFHPGDYRALFLWSVVPGLVALGFTLAAKKSTEEAKAGEPMEKRAGGAPIPGRFKAYLALLFMFTLGNSSDAFLLLRLSSAGVQEKFIPLLWAALHVVKSVSSLVGGRFADTIGRKASILTGWFLFGTVYLLLGTVSNLTFVVAVFLIYGVYHGLTESAEKALATDLVPASSRGTAFGLYNLVIGLGALPASLLFGFLWTQHGMMAAFLAGSAIAMSASLLLLILPLGSVPSESE